MNIGWPEGIVLGLMALNLLIAVALDGQPKGKHSRAEKMVDSAILFGLLYWGGFFA